MRTPLFYSVAALLLSAGCDTAGVDTSLQLPIERTIVVIAGDSLFATSVDDPSVSVSVRLANGRFYALGGPTQVNRLAEDGTLLISVKDRSETRFPLRPVIRISAEDPQNPAALGDPDESLRVQFVAASGTAYGLAWQSGDCPAWAVVRLRWGRSDVLACTDALRPDAQPQRMSVDEEESAAVIVYYETSDIVLGGDPMSLAVVGLGDGSSATAYRDVGRSVYDTRYRAGTVYFTEFYPGGVYSLEPGDERPVVVVQPATTVGRSGRRLFLLGDLLLTYQSGVGATTVYTTDLASGVGRSFEIPGEMVQAYEHDGYVVFRPFEFERSDPTPETFVGFCASRLSAGGTPEIETFKVALPAFAQTTALFSHSLSCRR